MNGDSACHWTRISRISDRVSIYDGPQKFVDDFRSLTLPEQVLVAAHWFEYEVVNGGLSQFFGNSTGVLAPEAVIAFRVLGMPRVASVITEATNQFGHTYPRDRDERCKWLADHAIAFAEQDEELYHLLDHESGGFDQAASRYAAAHGI